MSDAEFPIRPLFDNVFVRKDDASKTESGLHLPQSVKGRAVTGTVVAVGPGHLNVDTGNFVPCSVKVGDRVFLREFSGTFINLTRVGDKYKSDTKDWEIFVFHENEILGILKES